MSRAGSADVVVIGAGTVGAGIAHELARRGASVVVLEAGDDIGAGCSYANAGLLSPSHVEPLTTPANVLAGLRYMLRSDSPFYLHPAPRLAPWFARFVRASGPRRARELTARMQELATRSLQLHAEYAREGLDTGFRQNGALDVFATEDGLAHATRELETGPSESPSEVLSADKARAFEPTLGEVAGAIYHPDQAQCGTQQFVRAALAAAERNGATVRWGTRVQRIPVTGGRIDSVETAAGRFTADTYIVAAGLQSAQLCSQVGITMPMEAAKGYVVDLKVAGPGPTIPVSFREAKVVATPYADRLRLCGTLELGGKPDAIAPRRVQAIRDAGRRGFPDLEVTGTLQTWAGGRPCTADGVPSLGRSTLRPNLVVTAGHGMWGLVLAPVTGELVARGLLEGAPTLHEPAFAPDRFVASRRR